MVRKFISLTVILVTVSAFAAAQEKAPAKTPPIVKHVPITHTSPTSGKEMFENYCAVCHGKDAKGAGPAAPAMKIAPTDLTVLAKKEGGKYPAAHVAAVIRGQADLASHGSKDMPVWKNAEFWLEFTPPKAQGRLRPPKEGSWAHPAPATSLGVPRPLAT